MGIKKGEIEYYGGHGLPSGVQSEYTITYDDIDEPPYPDNKKHQALIAYFDKLEQRLR